jgi:hypothetical protein
VHALAEIGCTAREAVPALTEALRDSVSFVRVWAAAALARFDGDARWDLLRPQSGGVALGGGCCACKCAATKAQAEVPVDDRQAECRCLGTSKIQREKRDGTDAEHQYREGYRIVIEPMVGLNSHERHSRQGPPAVVLR